MTDKLDTVTFPNHDDKHLKTTIVLSKITKIQWDDHKKVAHVSLVGDSYGVTVWGEDNLITLCRVLGWETK